MRKAFVITITSCFLAACGSSTPDVACETQFWNGKVGTCLPTGWDLLSSETLDRYGIPSETVAAFQSTEARDGQFDTVTVTEEPLAQELSSEEYSAANIQAVSTLPDYNLQDKQDVTIDEQDTTLHIFAARPIPDKPIRRYYQVSIVQGSTGYTFTGSLPLSISGTAEQEVQFILRSATLIDPREE